LKFQILFSCFIVLLFVNTPDSFSGQSFSPALSWIPTQAGTYTATAFVWESVDNPTALSPPVSTTVTVQ